MANLGKRLDTYSQKLPTGPITLSFKDGTTATCDVLIGCDGLKSVVRRVMYQTLVDQGQPDMAQYITPVYTGEITYRALVPAERLPLRNGEKHPALTRTHIVSTL